MSQAKIVLLGPLNLQVKTRNREIDVEAGTLRDALNKVCVDYPGLRSHLFVADEISQSIAIFHNGESVSADSCGQTVLGIGDEICIATAICGG